MGKVQIGEKINHKYRSRDNFDIIFEVIEVNPTVICKFDTDLGYRVGYEADNETIAWVDPSGGPMIQVGRYDLNGYILKRVWFDGPYTYMEFE